MSTVDPRQLIATNLAAQHFYAQRLTRAAGPRRYLLGERHLPFDALEEPWLVGYAPHSAHALTNHLLDLDHSRDELFFAGLATPTSSGDFVDTFRDRIIFPLHTPAGPVGFIGRAAPGSTAPKYLNTRDTPIFHKGQTLYGLAEQADLASSGAVPVIVEGPLDLHAIRRCGPTWLPVATSGTSLTPDHVSQLLALPGARAVGIIVTFDDDLAGHQATLRAWHLLAPHPIGLRTALLPPGTDPGDLAHRPDQLAAALTAARPLGEKILDITLAQLLERHPDLLTHVEGRVNAARHLAALVIDRPPAEIVALSTHIAEATGALLETVTDAIIAAMEQ